MKLRLPHSLFLFLLSLTVTLPSAADVVGAGVYYDVGKIYYSSDPDAVMPNKGTRDSTYCWAGAASNVIQYWQDFYYNDRYSEEGVPNGVRDGYDSPYGTDYLNVYHEVLTHSIKDSTGDSESLYTWWMQGGTIDGVLSDKAAYYEDVYGSDSVYTKYSVDDGSNDSLKAFSDYVKETMSTPGHVLSLTISGTAYHAITCWGYELDGDGNVSALILSDTDDQQFGVFRMTVEQRECYLDVNSYAGHYGVYKNQGTQLSLVTDERHGYYGKDWTWVEAATALKKQSTLSADENITLKTSVHAGEKLSANTSLTKENIITGDGITVGDGKTALVLTATGDGALALNGQKDGQKSETTGLIMAEGTLVSLDGITIQNYQAGGLLAEGKAYFHQGDVTISDNETAGDGAGVDAYGYVEIKDCNEVSFTGNKATGEGSKGGAIHNTNLNKLPEDDDLYYDVRGEYPPGNSIVNTRDQSNYATVSIRGNKNVTFSGNQAALGNDIYNEAGALVNIADNEKVSFIGTGKNTDTGEYSVAVRNDGYLFMVAPDDCSIDFAGSALDSSEGSVAIGIDANRRSTNIGGSVNFYASADKTGASLSLKSTKTELCTNPKEYDLYGGEYEGYEFLVADVDKPLPSLLENVIVNVEQITGVSQENKGMVTNTTIATTGPLAISHLTMDTTDVVVSSGSGYVTLSDVVINVAESDIVGGVVDLSEMFTGNYRFENVVFNMGNVSNLSELKFNMSSAYAEEEAFAHQVMLTGSNGQTPVALAFGNVEFAASPVPEPTTSALSLLALAGLAARRRRR